MKIKLLLIAFFILAVFSVKPSDLVSGPPGMNNTVVYSGFLKTLLPNRKLHYVFVQADQKPEQAPLTLWLNGGPGCSSLIGFMQEIGPYLVGDTYEHGEPLIKNQYRWNKASNVIFIESPGLIGFSTDTDPTTKYSDNQTADDNFEAIKDFIWNIAPQFKNRPLYLTGQSYAGKYVPDIAVRILDHNRQQNVSYINLKGVLIGNGIMNHVDNSLIKSKIQYMIDHDFISPRLEEVYHTACKADFDSPRCQYFLYEFYIMRDQLNTHDVYEVCQSTGMSIEDIRTQQFIKRVYQKIKNDKNAQKYGANPQRSTQDFVSLKQINKCPIDDGLIDYLNQYKAVYNMFQVKKTWEPCSDIDYDITVPASMAEYRQIFLNSGVKVWLFSGDWDGVVPYPDTLYNINLLKRKKAGQMQPWFVGDRHAGFYQMYDSLNFITVTGAGHWVPIFKPAAAYQMFYNFIKDRPINTPV